jgi:hypothetical protein
MQWGMIGIRSDNSVILYKHIIDVYKYRIQQWNIWNKIVVLIEIKKKEGSMNKISFILL